MQFGLFGKRRSVGVWIFLLAIIGILGTGHAYAQVAGATLTGTVKDSSGAVIPNAQISITDLATSVSRSTRLISSVSPPLSVSSAIHLNKMNLRSRVSGQSPARSRGRVEVTYRVSGSFLEVQVVPLDLAPGWDQLVILNEESIQHELDRHVPAS